VNVRKLERENVNTFVWFVYSRLPENLFGGQVVMKFPASGY
jgi:hypothetical protein